MEQSINELRDKAERLRMISNVLLTIIGAASVLLAYVIASTI